MLARFIIKYFFLIIIIIPCLCNAQESSNWEEVLKSELSFEQKKIKMDSLISQYQQQNKDSVLERLTHKYAIWFYRNKKIDQAIETADYSIELKKANFPTDTALIQHGLSNLAFLYLKNRNYPKSITYYQELINLNSGSDRAAAAYSELGRSYKALGDYHKALTHFELAHSLLLKKNNLKRLITNTINASEVYINIGTQTSYRRGTQNLLLADSLSSIIQSKASTKYNIKLYLGNLYNQHETINPEKASYYYKQILNIAENNGDSLRIAQAYGLMGNLYNTIDPDLGIKYHKKALRHTKNNSFQYAVSYTNIGYCLIIKNTFNEGIKYYHKAINYLIGNSISETEIIPGSKELSQTVYKSHLLKILKDLGHAYLKKFKASKDDKALHKSITIFSFADELIDLIRIESQEFQSKLFWREQSSEIYGSAIEACYLAKDIHNAFYFMEKNKALLLTEDLINTKFRQSMKLPTELAKQETEFRKKIYILEKEKKENSNIDSDSISIVILNQKKRLEQLQDSIHNNFSGYTNIEMQSPITDLTSVQKDLDDETVLLEYNISEYTDYGPITDNGYTPIYKGSKYGKKKYSKGYLLSITKNDIYFIELQHADQLKTDVKQFIRQASVPFRIKEDITSYHQIGSKVYDHLFPTEKIKGITKNKKLRIIPDNYLNYVPFEALVSSTSEEKLRYLLEDCEISYGYSNSFLRNSAKTNTKTDKISFLGVAPGNFEKYNLIPLDNNIEEVTNINGLFSGRTLINSDASIEQFSNALKDKNIIHLATHADAMDSISPWIAFSNDKLRLEELYLTKNQAELVVLSGCNTLVGKQETGEGVMSLARGFFHSGAKSVVSSLWNVDDRSTAYIMNEFYKNLKNQQTKSQALREAKLSYLKNSSLSESSPHFWATFVLLGGTDPLQTSYTLSAYWLLLLLPLIFISIITYRSYRKEGF